VHGLVALPGTLALAVGEVLEDGRDGRAVGAGGQPQPRREAAAVREADPAVLDLPDVSGKRLDDLQGGGPPEKVEPW
jgi:hypothetical protein